MRRVLSRSLVLAVALTGLSGVGSGMAVAAPGPHGTSGDGGVLSGNRVVLRIGVPVNVCGNAVAVGGQAKSGCKSGS